MGNPCSENSTSFAWVDPAGTIHEVSSHNDWAIAWVRKNRVRLNAEIKALAWSPAEIRAKAREGRPEWRKQVWAPAYLLYNGWIRAGGAYAYMVWKHRYSLKAQETAVGVTAECLLRTGVDPERVTVYLDFKAGPQQLSTESMSAADFLEKWGGRRLANELYWNKRTSIRRIAQRYMRQRGIVS